jgi:hypothetical protein
MVLAEYGNEFLWRLGILKVLSVEKAIQPIRRIAFLSR